MDLEKKRKEVISFLRNYNLDSNDYKSRVVLAAPAHGNPNAIRLYMNGGGVGTIALNDRAVTTGINIKEYAKYEKEIPDIVYVVDKKSDASEFKRLDALISLEYLKYIQKATTAHSTKGNNDTDNERTIETIIMDRRNQKSGNAAIDMEMQYSAKEHFGWTRFKQAGREYPSTMKYKNHIWYNEEVFPDSDETKSPRVDLMVLNDNGIGFVELKVDNENCGNLSSHISHMEYILSHQEVFIKDIVRRLSVVKDYDLLEPEMKPNLDKWENNHHIWCGILFVGEEDKLDEAKQMINKEINDGQDIKCCFINKSVVKDKRLDLRSNVFVSKETFISSEYLGYNN